MAGPTPTLAGYPSGEGRRWYSHPLATHVARPGTAAPCLAGLWVAACNRWLMLDDEGLLDADDVPPPARCARNGCRQAWPAAPLRHSSTDGRQ